MAATSFAIGQPTVVGAQLAAEERMLNSTLQTPASATPERRDAVAALRNVVARGCCFTLLALAAWFQNSAYAAITVALTTQAVTTNAGTTQATASFLPVANTLYLMWTIQTIGTTPVTTPTVTCANGLNMVQVNTVAFDTIGTPLGRLTLFRAMKPSGLSNNTCTITWGQTTTGHGHVIVAYTGADPTGTDGSGAVVQSVTGATDNATAAAGLSIALAALQTGSTSTGGFSNSVNSATTLTAGAGYTASAGLAFNTPPTSIRAEWIIAGSTTVNMTQSATSNIGGIAVEVKRNPTTTLATGTDPAAATIAPGAAATDADGFTLQTNGGTEAITSVTVNLSTANGVGRLAITDSANTELGFTTTPAAGANVITVAGMSATTTLTAFKVRVTPLSHAAMPAPPGAAYAITAPVTAWGGTAIHAGSDTDANALTIDNLSPAGATATSGAAGDSKVTLNWTTSASADFNATSGSVLYRWTGAAGAEVPAEGSTATVNGTNGTATVACVRSSAGSTALAGNIDGSGGTTGCNTTALTNGTTYAYKVFQKDNNGNYDVGVSIGSFTPLLPAPPTVAKAFSATPIAINGTSTLTITITNPNASAINGLTFTDTYPSTNLKNAATPALANTCGGTATATAGASVLSLSGGTVGANSSCTVSVVVTSAVAAAYNNSTGAVTSTNAASGTAASATLTVTGISAANSTVVASPISVPADNTTTSTITVTLKDGASAPVAGKTVTLAAGSGSSTISAASGASNASGIVTFTVRDAVVQGPITYTATDTTDTVIVTQTAQVTFTKLIAPSVTMSFNPTSIAANGTSTMTLTFTNPNPVAITGLAFSDPYPANLKNAATPTFGNNCGGTPTGTAANNTTLGLTGGTVPANGSCTLNINLTATAGSYTNSTGTVTSTNAYSATPTSAVLNVFGAATKLVIYQQPGNTTIATAISPAVTVQIQDANSNVVTTDNTTMVTLAKTAGLPSCGGTLSGGGAVQAVNGVATFSSLALSSAGTACTLTATSAPVLTSAVSVAFDITALPASKLAFSVQPSKAAPNAAIAPAITVLIQDSANNTITASTATVTLAIGVNPGGGTLAGTTSVAAVAGVATFSNLSINSVGTGYTLTAASSGLTGATSSAFNITTATKLAFFQQPSNTSASSSITPAVTVQIQDAGGTLVTTSTDTVTVAIGNNPGGGTLGGIQSVAAVGGVATFSNLSINAAGTGYTLVANALGLTGGTSVGFNISPLVCFTDNFTDLSNWSVGNQGGAFGNPIATSNRLRLIGGLPATPNTPTTSSSTYATLQRLFPAFGNKVVVEFLHYAYGGTSPGADGIGIVLSDASQAPAAGAFGGSMGYAPKRQDATPVAGDTTHPGFVGGWLGVALDEWGNYSANTEGRTGGSAPGVTAQAVAVRGSGAGYTGYSYLGGTGSSPGGKGIDLDYASQTHLATSGPGYKYRIIIDHSDAVHAYTSVERDLLQGAGYQYLVSPFDSKVEPGQAGVPAQWYLSLTGATGASTNIHEIANLSVCSNSQNTIALDHIELDHLATGFPTIGSAVTVKACADAACSTLFLNSVTVNLSTALVSGTGTSSWATNPVTFTGGQVTATLTQTAAATLNLAATATSPTAINPTTCYVGSTASCQMIFSTVAFDAVQPGANPATPIFLKIAGQSFSLDLLAVTSGAINTGFTGAVTIDLVNPGAASGNCSDTNTGLTNPTTATFVAGDNGRHPFTFNYANAAFNVKVRMQFGGNVYCSSDYFVIRPATLVLSTTSSLNPASNTLAAGADFNLTVTAWNNSTVPAPVASGYVGTATNPVIPVIDPSFATIQDQNNVAITSTDWNGTFSAATGTSASGTFQYLDVGTLNFLANAITDSTFYYNDQITGIDPRTNIDHGGNGDCVSASTSNTLTSGRYGCNIGSTALGTRLGNFIPDHFTLTLGSITPACPSGGYTYMGQPFTIAYTLEARSMARPLNISDTVTLAEIRTQKYTTLTPPYSPIPTPTLVAEDGVNQGTDLGSRITGLQTPGWVAGQYIIPNTIANATFSRPSAPVAAPLVPNGGGPFDLLTLGVRMVDGSAVIANRDMNAATSTDCATAANCDARQLLTNNPTKMRFGILTLDSASGSQQLNMQVPVRAMYMNSAPSQFVVNTLDSCTQLLPANIAISSQTPASFSTNFNTGNRPASIPPLAAGVGKIILTKPTANASGKANIALNLTASGTVDVSCNPVNATSTAANLPWLEGSWAAPASCHGYAAYAQDPSASVTFGTNRSVLIYIREKY
ncbi:MAG: hypothetical protein NT159_16965 [Proteobacteria bacterium]|nr:hypothetical protein [Pseudomonadota bacterium]